jgi:hypothetical protein
MEKIVRDLRILWRAESIVAEIQFHDFMARSELRGFAAVMAVFALFMLNLAGYFGLAPWSSPVWASVAMAAIDLGLAAVLLAFASSAKQGRDLDLAREVRQTALVALEAHARDMQQEVTSLRDEICGIRAALSRLAHNPLDALLPAIVVPVTRVLLKTLHKRESPQAPSQ